MISPTPIPIDTTIILICKSFNITRYAFSGKTKANELVRARSIFCKIMRDHKLTLSNIGTYIGRSHCDVIHLLKKHDEYLEEYEYNSIFQQLSKQQDIQFIKERINYHENEIVELKKLLEQCKK